MFAAANVEKVIRHLVRFGSTHAEAEDLAQEALLIAWRKKAEVDRDRSLDAWLFGIARNVYRNHARSVRRSPMTDAPDADRIVAPPAIADALALRAALQTLPEDQQDIVILHELEEYTLKETAELLAIPFDTAKDRLRRAREALRATMSADFAVAGDAERRESRRFSGIAAASVLAGFLGVLASSGTAAAATAGAVAGSGGAATTATAASSAAAASSGGAGASSVASSGGAGAMGTAVSGAAATGWLAKVAIGTLLVGAGVAVGVVGERTRWGHGEADRAPATAQLEAPASPVIATEPPVVAPSVTAAPAVPPPIAAPAIATPAVVVLPAGGSATAPTARPTPSPVADPDPSGPGANAEAQVIERARTALTRGRHDEALRTLMSHERRFPAGQLAEERDVLLIDAYVGAGRLEIARDRIDQFRAAYPASIHRTKVSDLERDLERQRTAPP